MCWSWKTNWRSVRFSTFAIDSYSYSSSTIYFFLLTLIFFKCTYTTIFLGRAPVLSIKNTYCDIHYTGLYEQVHSVAYILLWLDLCYPVYSLCKYIIYKYHTWLIHTITKFNNTLMYSIMIMNITIIIYMVNNPQHNIPVLYNGLNVM